MIGIGITTNGRTNLLKELLNSISEFTDMSNIKVYIADDSIERKGIAFRKNECLRALKLCEHIFLFDDDVRILKHGWVDFFTNSGHEHLLFMSNYKHQRLLTSDKDIDIYGMCGGAFMYMNKKAFEKVGAFNEKFGLYGFEHAEYSNRIYGKRNYYKMLKGTENYIYSHDYSTSGHLSSIDELEKVKLVNTNWSKYFSEKQTTYLPL